jgi:hypothetical protein
MKRCACLIVFNEMEFLPFNLPFIVNYFDKTIVIDGGPAGTSVDGTWEWLNKNFGNNDKVYLETGKYGSFERENNWNKVMRNRYFRILDDWEDKYAWIHTIDPDEFYHKKDLDFLGGMMHGGIDLIRFPFYHFMGDKNHYCPGYDHVSRYLHKFFRYERGIQYVANDIWVHDKDGKRLAEKRVAMNHDIHMYHYGYLCSKEKMSFRQYRYAKRGDFGPESEKNLTMQWNEYINFYKDRREVSDDLIVFKGEHPAHAIPFLDKK